ncbi:hypothetical protein [Sphingobium nicotianae]|uniref:Uncharacterized protein n=1 Tax=Sphingobium nicotianae TaxID=2782607 RepID=A0A9X1IQE6_9SPHN|nr:hypothetical protein [Sphingobium nicotianae]MBT2186703.1 hypothetical protein [Sphingobium nicotianae]
MGKELAVPSPLAGRVVRPAINGKTKIIDTTGKRWSERAERVFLEMLAATCNVRLAAREVGFSTVAIYRRRLRYPAFAALWAEAMEHGYARIEAQLVERATDSVVRLELDGDWEQAGEPLSNAEMMNLLRLHRASVRGGKAQHYDANRKAPTLDAVRASILRKIEAIERWDAREAAKRAAKEAAVAVAGEEAGGAGV